MTTSLAPPAYMSAVSKNVIPPSIARRTIGPRGLSRAPSRAATGRRSSSSRARAARRAARSGRAEPAGAVSVAMEVLTGLPGLLNGCRRVFAHGRYLRGGARGAARAAARARRAASGSPATSSSTRTTSVLHELRLPRHRAAGRLRAERGGRDGRVRARVRGRADARRDRRSSASSRTPSTPGSSTRCGSSRACSPTWGSAARSAPTRTATRASSATRGRRSARSRRARSRRSRRDRGDDGAQERGRDRADPRERALVRARAPAAAGVLAAGRDRGRGEPARGPRGDARDARGARRAYGGQQASSDGVSAGYRGQIGLRSSWAHAVAHNIEFQAGRRARHRDERADLGLQRRARAGDDHRPADRRDAPPLRPHRRRAAGRVRRAPARRHVRRRGRRRDALLRGATTSLPYWRQHTGHAIGLRNHEAPFLDLGDHTPIEPGMVFTIEPGLYAADDRRLPPLRHRRRHARRDRASSPTTRATSRA